MCVVRRLQTNHNSDWRAARQTLLESMHIARRFALVTAAALSLKHAPAAVGIEQLLPQVLFPLSWTGRWAVERKLESIDGDATAAETAWRAIGGNGVFVSGHIEEYENAFLLQEGEQGTIADWQTELATRNSLSDTADLQCSGNVIRFKRRADRNWSELQLLHATSIRTMSNYGALETWAVADESHRQQLVVQVRRSYMPVNSQGAILASEVVSTERPASTTRSSLTLRPTFRPLSDPVKRKQASRDLT